MWPSLESHGGKVICLMKGLIGLSPTTLVQLTSYNDTQAWDGSQDSWPSLPEQFVERETVRVLKPISQRTKNVIPVEDRRPVYGYRKFIISPNDLSEFVTCSENGIWPRIKPMGASKELRDIEMPYRSRRIELTKTTKVNLMTSLDIDH